MTSRIFRIIIAKPGLDGHDRGARTIALALKDAGMEVIYTGLHWTPEMIADAALQERVHAVGLSVLSGAHMTIFPRVMEALKKLQIDDILLFGGGVIPPGDANKLKEIGVDEIFPPGTATRKVVDYLKKRLDPPCV